MCWWKFEKGTKKSRSLRVEMASPASNIAHFGTQGSKLPIQRPGFCLAKLTSAYPVNKLWFPNQGQP